MGRNPPSPLYKSSRSDEVRTDTHLTCAGHTLKTRTMTREKRIGKYFCTYPSVHKRDIQELMLRMSQEEFDHAMKVRVQLDTTPGHLLCFCSGDKPHRFKDCSKVPGGSKCPHRITKGKNKGGFKKKCPECCPKNFCPHKLRRDNCHTCKLKGKGLHGQRSSRFKNKSLEGSSSTPQLPTVDPVDPDPSEEENINPDHFPFNVDVEDNFDHFPLDQEPSIVEPDPSICDEEENINPESSNFDHFPFDVEDVEDFEDVEDVPLPVPDVLQDDQDVQHVPFLEEGFDF